MLKAQVTKYPSPTFWTRGKADKYMFHTGIIEDVAHGHTCLRFRTDIDMFESVWYPDSCITITKSEASDSEVLHAMASRDKWYLRELSNCDTLGSKRHLMKQLGRLIIEGKVVSQMGDKGVRTYSLTEMPC